MKQPSFPIILLALLITVSLPRHLSAEETANVLFVKGYDAVELGLKRERERKFKAALERYRAAASHFERLKQKYPDWNVSMVDARIKRTAAMITGLEASMEVQAIAAKERSAKARTVPSPDTDQTADGKKQE